LRLSQISARGSTDAKRLGTRRFKYHALPHETAERAILADAGNFADPFGLNLLEITSKPAAVQRNFIANQLVGVFQSVLYRGVSEAFGPMFAAYFRNALFLLMEAEDSNASLADFDRVFAEPAYRRSLLERSADPHWTCPVFVPLPVLV